MAGLGIHQLGRILRRPRLAGGKAGGRRSLRISTCAVLWLAAFGVTTAHAQTVHECGVIGGVVVDGTFRLDGDRFPTLTFFGVGDSLTRDARIAELVREADATWPGGWILRTAYDSAGGAIEGLVTGEGWTLACINPPLAAVTPPAPPPAPPSFQPQPVHVALGNYGGTLTLMTTEAGGFTLDGRRFTGGAVEAENGNRYVLTLADGQWTATFQSPTFLVTLGESGEQVTISQAEDGAYWLDGSAVASGKTIKAADGSEFRLILSDGKWHADLVNPSTSQLPANGEPSEARITITNLTPGQIMAPPIVIIHSKDARPVFSPGEPASAALAMLAEDNQSSLVLNAATSDPDVSSAQVLLGAGPDGTIRPGESASLSATVRAGADRVTVVASLTVTNDGFVGVVGVPVPVSDALSQFIGAWDAGTESNTEDCDHVLGGPCSSFGQGTPENGVIVAHSGIHGHGDLAARRYDWNYPAASIKVELVGNR